jgi:hypothetical protein
MMGPVFSFSRWGEDSFFLGFLLPRDSGDPHEVGYSLNNGGHNISFGKCTRGLTILDPKFRLKANS